MSDAAASILPTVNRRDIDFHLFEVLNVAALMSRSRYSDHDKSVFNEVLNTAQTVATTHFQNHYRLADRNPPFLRDGKVVTLPETANAVRQFVSAGFLGADRDYERGGMQLPFAVVQSCFAFFQAANNATTSYCFLTSAAASVIENYGSGDQKRLYLGPMLEGRFLGTMCLSEPQAGSGLSDTKTRATLQADGSYLIRGTKMWISAGDHEISDNIVHLVLARIDGGPPGVKGLSMFVVPKRRVKPDGSVADPNGVRLMGLNHKMGVRGITNTVLSFGESDDCFGEILGCPNKGLFYMFQMMNEARISVGLGATMLGSAGYIYSLDYAKTRLQGRLPDERDPTKPPVPIIEHADVKRMLLAQKAAVEGALGLCLYAATLVDDIRTHPDDRQRDSSRTLLDLITPIVKAWPSEYCLEANKHAIQVLGGYGYTQDFLVEQLYRDNRLNPIHEGTNGIQAIDLMGRKILMKSGQALKVLKAAISDDIAKAKTIKAVAQTADDLSGWLDRLLDTTVKITPRADTDAVRYLASATHYADAFGHVLIGWMWLKQAHVAAAALRDGATGDSAMFYRGKLAACEYFFTFEMGRIDHWLNVVSQDRVVTVDTKAEWL